jgi:hypothetical protein
MGQILSYGGFGTSTMNPLEVLHLSLTITVVDTNEVTLSDENELDSSPSVYFIVRGRLDNIVNIIC